MPDDFAAMEEVLGRRFARWEQQRDVSPHDKDYDPSFAALPNVVVIDGGKGQLAAGLRALQGFSERGVTVISLAKRIEEVFLAGVSQPLVLAHDTPELQLLQRVRDEAHRFAIGSHRARRKKDIREAGLQEIPGIGPTRKRALLRHFGTMKAIERASLPDLAQVPGINAETARKIYEFFHEQAR
jgi:excinuclease ABC subunit C